MCSSDLANKALRRDVGARVRRLEGADDAAFTLDRAGRIVWESHPIARLAAGETAFEPRVEVLPADLLEPPHREAIRRRLTAWLDARLAADLAPLHRLAHAELAAAARGVAYQTLATLGAIPRARAATQIAALAKADRRALAALGVIVGQAAVYMPALDRPAPIELRALLWQVHRAMPIVPWPQLYPQGLPKAVGRTGAPDETLLAACGYLPAGPLFVRVSALERLAGTARQMEKAGPIVATAELAQLVGAARSEEHTSELQSLAYLVCRLLL